MELVYLWVEKYNNIEKQGFNFSPRFYCKYDKNIHELIIRNDKDYMPDFFGDNIDVTAIVGKNGSGKSSVLEILYLINKENSNKNIFYIFYDDSEKCFIKSVKNLRLNKPNIYLEKQGNTNFSNLLYVDVSHFKKDIFENSSSFRTINEWKYQLQGTAISTSSDYENTLFEVHKVFKTMETATQLKLFSNNTIQQFIVNIFKISKPSYLKISLAEDYDDNDSLENKLTKINNDIVKQITKYGKYIEDDLIIDIKYKDEISRFLSLLYDKIECCLYISFIDKSHNEIYFSSGEQIILYYLGIFYNMDENSYLIIDEIDLYLHPTWQKNTINILVRFFKIINKNSRIILSSHSPFLLSDLPKENIIFLDTYKEKDEEVKNGLQKAGNCKVLPRNEVLKKKQTFGANIHTLLSDSFFMKDDGLMGAFAKSKIEEVIKFLNNEKSEIKDDIEAEGIIDIIGELILQKKLQVMLERYKEENNLINPQDIEKQIQELQEQLDRIQKNG